MTSRLSAASEFRESAESGPTPRIADEGPYARPGAMPAGRAVDAVLIDAIRASVGPFVPAPWRTTSAASSEATTLEPTDLPWIESFLDTAAGALEAPDEAAIPEVVGAVSEDPSDEPDPESFAEAPPASVVGDEWPLEEAGLAMREIADDLIGHEDAPAPSGTANDGDSREASTDASAGAAMPPLRMWSEDDMMDIMPVKRSVAAADNGEQWAARARRETNGAGSPESAAQALEALARRVRNGEIQLPAFSAEMGEAATLAAALAGLLSARR